MRPGGLCRLPTATAKTRIGVFAAGATGALGSAARAADRRSRLRVAHQPLQDSGECGRRSAWQRRYRTHERGLNTKLHLAVDAHGMPIRIFATKGTRADCAKADEWIDGFVADHLIADKGYDSHAIVDQAHTQAMPAQIPSRRHRKTQRSIDSVLYRHRHRVEKAFEQLKRRRGLATRYAKRLPSFLAYAQTACPVSA